MEHIEKKKVSNKLKATPTNPFEGERRELHKSWMSVMSEGNLTQKFTKKTNKS